MPTNLFEIRANKFNGGLDMNSDKNLSPEQIYSGQSLRFARGTGIMTGPGFLQVARPTASDVRLDGSLATQIFPCAWVKCGTKVYYAPAALALTFYDSGVTVTTSTETSFIEQSNGDVLMGNKTDAPLRFAIAKATVAIAASDVTITVGANQIGKFAASGNVVVNGDVIAYTGKSATALTGVTGIQTGGHVVNSLVIQSTNPTTWVEEKGHILAQVEKRLLVAGVTDREGVVYYSAIEDLVNPEFFYDFDGNGSYAKELPGKVTAIITGVGGGYIFLQRGIHKILGFDIQTGGLLTQEISSAYGAYNYKCVIDMDGVVCFMGEGRFMPITLTLDTKAEVAPFLQEGFDHPIRPWLERHDGHTDQGDAYLKYDPMQKIVKMGAVVDGALETYPFDKQNPGFLPRENRNVGTSFFFLNKSYFGDRDNGRIYEDDFGRTNNLTAVSHSISTGRIEYDKGRKYMKSKIFEYEGWMTKGTEHTLKIYVDGSATASVEKDFDDSLITSTKGKAIGTRGSGISTPGELGGGVNVFPFKNKIILRGINGDDFRFEWIVTGDGHFLQLNTWYFSANPTPRSPRTAS